MKLPLDQKRIIYKYCKAIGLGDSLGVWNDQYDQFEKMILGLRNCQMLGASDVINIAVDHAISIHSKLKADAEKGADSSVSRSDAAQQLSEQLSAFVESMPRPCEVRVSLPSFPSWGIFTCDLAPGIKIVSDALPHVTPRNRLMQLAMSLELPNTPTLKTYLVVDVRGYAADTADSATVAKALATAKVCTFLLLETGVCENTWGPEATAVTVKDVVSDKYSNIPISAKLARHMGSLTPNSKQLTVFDSARGNSLLASFRVPETDEERIEALKGEMQKVGKIMKVYEDHKFQPLATAIEWYQDSVVSEDQTIAYLAACIGLESILGENDMPEMSKRLEDRYAFLLGKDRDERKKLAQEYGAVLKTRGQLVHARAKKLGQRDFELLVTARSMLRRSISHELKPFRRD